MDAPALLAAEPKAQVILCSGEAERFRAAFPHCIVVVANGDLTATDFAGRDVIVFGAGIAEVLAPHPKRLRVIAEALPDGLEAHQAARWARDRARAYQPISQEPVAPGADLGAEPATTGEGGTTPAVLTDVAMPAEPPQDGSAPLLSEDDSTDSQDEPPIRERPSVWEDAPKDGWPVPVDFWEGAHLPELDYTWLPPELVDWIFDHAALTGCSIGMVALNALVALGGIVDGRIRVMPKPADHLWVEPCILWGVTCGESGVGKDAASKPIIRAIHAQERERAKIDDGARADYDWAMEQWRGACEKAKKNNGARPEQPVKPKIERLITEDFTTEGLGEIIEENRRQHILAFGYELAGLWGRMDAYAEGRNADKDRPFFLALFAGEPYKIDRATHAGSPRARSRFVPSLGASILGGIQPSTLARIMHRHHFAEDGMAARFMVVHGAPQVLGEERGPDKVANASFHRIIDRLIALQPASAPVQLSHEANAVRMEASAWVRQVGAMELPPGMAAHVRKWEALVCRIALAHHAIHCAAQNLPMIGPEIDGATMTRAWGWLRKFAWHHSMRLYESVLSAPDDEHMIRWTAGLILVREWSQVSTTDMGENWSGYYRQLRTPARRKEFWGTFERAGWLRGVPGSMNSDRIFTRYEVNKKCHDGRFARQKAEYRDQRERYREIQPERMPRMRGRL